MGFFRSWAKTVAYPIVRPAKDLKASAAQLAASVAAAREAKEQKRAAAQAVQEFLKEKSPQEKFAELFEAGQWTEAELARQLIAVRRTRLAMLATGVIGFLALLALMWVLQRWLVFILGPFAVIVFAGCVALGFRYAWWEYSIETRTLTPFSQFMSRDDLFHRLFRVSA